MVYDISLPLSPELPVWPGDPPIVLERIARMDEGATANVSRLVGTVHIGTHIDAPDHFLNNGVTTDRLPLEVFFGPAWVLAVPEEAEHITSAVLSALDWPPQAQRVLFRTRNSRWWARGDTRFHTDYAAVTPDAARWLVERGVRLVGIDYLSIAPYDDPAPTHRILMEAGVVILEGIRLDHVPPGKYTLTCFPLALRGAEGAPARALLWEGDMPVEG